MYSKGQHIIQSFRQKWIRNTIIANGLLALAFSFILSIIFYNFFSLTLWASPILFVIAFIVLLFIKQPWKITNDNIVSFLNKRYPELEESCGLFLDDKPLNLLETLQAERTLQALLRLQQPAEFIKPLRTSALTLVLLGITGIALAFVHLHFTHSKKPVNNNSSIVIQPEKILPGIKAVTITVNPPVYTRHTQREQNQFNLTIEEGSNISWQIKTTTTVQKLQLVFNDSSVLTLNPATNENNNWQASRKITNSGFYQVMMDGTPSEFYKLEVIKDKAPVITITSPKPNTTIEYGEPQRVTVNAHVSDDYGVKNASIIATIASGSGEAVKFKEQTISFPNSFTAQSANYSLQRMIDLSALDMHPADELYFYIKATDNHNQEKRSDIYIVTLADTAQLMESDVQLGNVKLKPEYFRSERQIIIETEQLLKDKDTLSAEEFKNRSNNLGIDQKLLRLRYSKFLGDENEGGEGAPGDDGKSALSDPANFGNAAAVIDAYSDKHDNAEDATFFTDDVKQQLKATLTEMWGAELRLRTFKPQEALPYEYKALRLLKDLQQKSRAYVPKTTFKTTPLKPDKRLTGDLSKITQSETQQNITKPITDNDAVIAALAMLEQLKTTQLINTANLQQAMQILSNKAAAEPAVYLIGLQGLKKIIEALQNKKIASPKDILAAQHALQKIATAPGRLPKKTSGLPYNQLQQQYFKNLKKASAN